MGRGGKPSGRQFSTADSTAPAGPVPVPCAEPRCPPAPTAPRLAPAPPRETAVPWGQRLSARPSPGRQMKFGFRAAGAGVKGCLC